MMMIYDTNKARSRVKTSLTIVLKTKNKEGIETAFVVYLVTVLSVNDPRPELTIRVTTSTDSHLSSKGSKTPPVAQSVSSR